MHDRRQEKWAEPQKIEVHSNRSKQTRAACTLEKSSAAIMLGRRSRGILPIFPGGYLKMNKDRHNSYSLGSFTTLGMSGITRKLNSVEGEGEGGLGSTLLGVPPFFLADDFEVLSASLSDTPPPLD